MATSNTVKDNEPKNNTIKYRIIDDSSIKKFKLEIKNILLNVILQMNDAPTAFSEFYRQFNELYEKYFPIKSRIAKRKEIIKPWVTPPLVKCIKIRDRLAKKANKGKVSINVYRNFRNRVTTLLREAKAQFYHTEFYKFKDDIKKTWGTINDAIKQKKVSNNIVINENDNNIEELNIPSKFCTYFTTIADKLVAEIPNSNVDPKTYLKNREMNSFLMSPIFNDEIQKAIVDLKDNGCGLYKFSTKVLIAARNDISIILAHVFNLCISQSYFPSELKTGCITPVYKKGDKTDIKNYRPVCSLSPLSKIFEKVVYIRMVEFIDKNNIFSKSQFGFRKKKSTETALMKFTDFVQNGLSQKHNVGTIFMDLSRAFDVMNHDILKVKLEHYGFRGIFLNFIMNFVRERKYFVNVNGNNSEVRTVNIGIPQGSTLGPLLFLLYVNDMENSSTLLQFVQFADDTTIMFSCDSFNQLQLIFQTEGNKVIDWLIANKLIINLTKTQSMIFSYKRGNPKFTVNLKNSIIEEQQTTSFLGVIIDNKLTWKAHIAHLCSKISKGIAILRLLRPSFPKHILKMIYMSLIHSYLNYCNLIWGSAENTISNPLFILQKKAIRIVDKAYFLEHTKPIFKTHKVLTLHQIYDLNCLLFAYKCINCNLFPTFKDKISHIHSIHDHNTRSKIFQRSFFFYGIKLWNLIDSTLKNVNSLYRFKITIKEYLYDKGVIV